MYFLPKYKRGIFNRYRKGMPILEMLTKDMLHALRYFYLYLKNGFKKKKLLIHPHYPSSGSTIYKLAHSMGYSISNKPDNQFEIAIYWEYLTFREEYQLLEKLAREIEVVNLYSRDISKVYLEDCFQNIFGYSTFIDPLQYNGKCVKKNDINAKHDGEILNCPVDKKEEGYIYQILINNAVNDQWVEDIRVPIVLGIVDYVYIKRRGIHERFLNTTIKTIVKRTIDVFTSSEINSINRMCEEMNFEYGELDVLRNKDDLKIYVIDANNTPQGPPANTSKSDGSLVMNNIAEYFQKQFIK